jgi:DNA-binding transcriptional MerR regulator
MGINEVAERLGQKPQTIRAYVRQGGCRSASSCRAAGWSMFNFEASHRAKQSRGKARNREAVQTLR